MGDWLFRPHCRIQSKQKTSDTKSIGKRFSSIGSLRSRKVKKVRRPATAMHLVGWYQKETSVSDDTGVEETGEGAATWRGARGLDCRHEHGPSLWLFCLQSAAQDTNQVRRLFDGSIEAYHPIVPCIQFLRQSAPLRPPA